jgi:hypothetical protein
MKETNTEWKSVVDYEGLYEVSENGKVRNVKTQKILVTGCKSGYELINLSSEGKVKTTSIHRLVAKSFIDNPLNKSQVNHINGNKLNNQVTNLEWATPKENTNHALKTGLRKHSYVSKNVIDLLTGISYESLSEACRKNNYSYSRAHGQIFFKYKNQRFKYI